MGGTRPPLHSFCIILCMGKTIQPKSKMASNICIKFKKNPNYKVQSQAYKLFKTEIKIDWLSLLQRRVCSLSPGYGRTVEVASKFISSKCLQNSLNVTMMVLRTISNSWTTTYRFDETIKLPCVFGCNECKDELKHYLNCNVLWQLVFEISGGDWLSDIPSRLCISDAGSPKRTALAHLIYHYIKVGNRQLLPAISETSKHVILMKCRAYGVVAWRDLR